MFLNETEEEDRVEASSTGHHWYALMNLRNLSTLATHVLLHM